MPGRERKGLPVWIAGCRSGGQKVAADEKAGWKNKTKTEQKKKKARAALPRREPVKMEAGGTVSNRANIALLIFANEAPLNNFFWFFFLLSKSAVSAARSETRLIREGTRKH